MSKTDRFIPTAFQKYVDCKECEVTVHGPQRANSPGGCHVELCDIHVEGGR